MRAHPEDAQLERREGGSGSAIVVDAARWGAGEAAAADELLFTRRARLLLGMWVCGVLGYLAAAIGLLTVLSGGILRGSSALAYGSGLAIASFWLARYRSRLHEKRLVVWGAAPTDLAEEGVSGHRARLLPAMLVSGALGFLMPAFGVLTALSGHILQGLALLTCGMALAFASFWLVRRRALLQADLEALRTPSPVAREREGPATRSVVGG